jgi:pSer/pThr/pTyr-binding forkhead associated (FHA) protein
MDTSAYRFMVDNSKPKAVDPHASVKKKDAIAILSFLDSDNGKYKCRKSITKIGKHRDSDIIVKGFLVGRTSATISKKPDGFYLSYVGGMLRPKVNAKKVKREKILHDNDIIEIGTTTMQFSERRPKKNKRKKFDQARPIPQDAAE